MKEKNSESKLKKFIDYAFTSEAKASRIPYYFFAICVLLTVICIQLNTANRHLKRIASGGSSTYSFQTNAESNDPYEIFSDKTDESATKSQSDNKETASNTSSSSATASNSSDTTVIVSKPQGSTKTYVINKSSKKIHYSTCSYAKNMKEENKLTVKLTYEELQNQYLSNGYVFCSKCIG